MMQWSSCQSSVRVAAAISTNPGSCVLAIMAGLLLTGCGGLISGADDSSLNLPPGMSVERHVLRHGQDMRSYILHVPVSVAQGPARVPLVLVLHGGGGNALHGIRMTGFSQQSARRRVHRGLP